MTRWARRRAAIVLAATLAGPAAAEEDGLSFEDDLFVIEGKVQKPEVTVVVSRENLDKGFTLNLRESFVHKIVDALVKPPF